MWVLLAALLPLPEGDLIMTDVVFKPRGQLISSVLGPVFTCHEAGHRWH